MTGRRHRIAVAIAADARYAMGAGVAMFAVARSLPRDVELDLVLLDCGLTPTQAGVLRDAAGRWRERTSLHVLGVPLGPFRGAPLGNHFSIAAYARLLLPELRPDLARAIYLDADTLPLADISPLATLTLSPTEAGAAAVDATFTTLASGLPSGAWGPGRGPASPYFNSGVMLMDLECWREDQLGRRVVDHLTLHADTNRLVDQDAINGAIGRRLQSLSGRWNYQIGREALSRRSRVAPAARDAAILHFIGGKPWQAHGLTADLTAGWARRRWVEALDGAGLLSRRQRIGMSIDLLADHTKRVHGKLIGPGASSGLSDHR